MRWARKQQFTRLAVTKIIKIVATGSDARVKIDWLPLFENLFQISWIKLEHTFCSDMFVVFVSGADLPNMLDLRLTRKISVSESELPLYSMGEALQELISLQASAMQDELPSNGPFPSTDDVFMNCLVIGQIWSVRAAWN